MDNAWLYAVIGLAITFDFINGFHDSANAISTVVATRALRPWQALAVAGLSNFLGPFIFGVAVAKAVQGDILDLHNPIIAHDGLIIVCAALIGAIVWNLITWRMGIPSSSSHALIGGLLGAGVAAAGSSAVKWVANDQMLRFGEVALGAIVIGAVLGFLGAMAARQEKRGTWAFFAGYVGLAAASVWAVLPGNVALGAVGKTIVFMVVSPFLGFVVTYLVTLLLMSSLRKARPGTVNKTFGKLQIASSAFYSLTHGSNDGQKTMGIIAGALVVVGIKAADLPGGDFHATGIPTIVVFTAATAIGLGTMFGGWRIVKTMATKITDLSPYQGFAAETGGGVALFFMAQQGIPVSTTHAISGSIMGVGATRSMSAVQWGVARRLVVAWIITIPAAALVAAATSLLLTRIF
ncbi:MAG: inorganic phosphate transporter [bacterium]